MDFRDLFTARKTQTWLLLHRGHPERDLWSREKWAVRGLLVELICRSVWQDSQGTSMKKPAPHKDMHSNQNTAGEARFHCFSLPSLTSFLPFPFFFTLPKVNTLCSGCCPDTASQAGFNSNPCFQSSTRWSVKDFQPCSQPDSQRGQWLVHREMCFLPCSSKREVDGGNRCGKYRPPSCSLSLRSCKKQIWALFQCSGNDCSVLLMEKGCWFWQWGYHVAMQAHKAGRK